MLKKLVSFAYIPLSRHVGLLLFVCFNFEMLEDFRYRILVGKPDGKRLLGRSRRRWVDNIKIDLREIGWYVVDWIDLAQDRDQ
jgi:hypothetical protein